MNDQPKCQHGFTACPDCFPGEHGGAIPTHGAIERATLETLRGTPALPDAPPSAVARAIPGGRDRLLAKINADPERRAAYGAGYDLGWTHAAIVADACESRGIAAPSLAAPYTLADAPDADDVYGPLEREHDSAMEGFGPFGSKVRGSNSWGYEHGFEDALAALDAGAGALAFLEVTREHSGTEDGALWYVRAPDSFQTPRRVDGGYMDRASALAARIYLASDADALASAIADAETAALADAREAFERANPDARDRRIERARIYGQTAVDAELDARERARRSY
jgi:hypothetical protein